MKNFIYKLQKSFLRITFFLMVSVAIYPVSAQTTNEETSKPKIKEVEENHELVTVKGRIFDEASKNPLAGIQLKTLGNDRYASMTGDDGTFEIKVPIYATSLYVYSPEYSSLQVAIPTNLKDELIVYMLSDKYRPMYENGTFITARRSFTAKEVQNLTIDNEISTQLNGDIRSIQRSGAPAIGNTTFIRGINSINATSQPLIVVDGVELDMQLNRDILHQGNFNNLLTSIMPADIEKVTVLKNATSLYGARGANGVILIDTKRGHSMATRVDANVSVGLSLVPRLPKMMDATQYRMYASELLGTFEDMKVNTPNLEFMNDDPSSYYYHTYHNNTDWTDYVYSEALTQNYSINVQGGDNVGMYNLSVGYVDGKSSAKGNDFSRMNVRFNTDLNILKNLDTKFNLSISRTTNNLKSDGASADLTQETPVTPGFLSLIKSPLLAPYQYNKYLNGFSDLLSEADDLYKQLGVEHSLANPVGILKEADGENKNFMENTNFRAMLEPKVSLSKDLSITALFSYYLNRNSQRYTRPTGIVPAFTIANLGTVYNQFSTMFSSENNVVGGIRVDYSHAFGAHSLNAFAGFRYNYNSYSSDLLSTQYTDGNQNNKNPSISSSDNHYNSAGGDNDIWKQLQWYGNIDYNYMNKYFLTLSLLGEANSRFGENASGLGLCGINWALFPSVQFGWIVTNESWFPKNVGIDYLRLNAGYDISGNDDINNYAARTIYTMVKYNYMANGLQLTNIGNDKIEWETTKKFNVGLEGYFLHNRLGISFDYFIHKTNNLLTLKNFNDQISGINRYWANSGALQNSGFEFSLSVKPIVTKSWNVELGASVGHYKNEVIELPNGTYEEYSIYGYKNIRSIVGAPVAQFYGYKTNGVFADDESAKKAHLNVDGTTDYLFMYDETGAKKYFKAGDVHFVDLDNNGEINENDRTVIGDPNPDIYGNLFANINWKNFTLSFNFNYNIGNDVYNYQRMLLTSGSNFWNQQVSITNHWRYEGQQTNMPRIEYGDPMQNNRFSDRWIEDGSFLRLKTLTLSYKVPMNNDWLQGLTVWAQATNLFTITKYLGSDPEFSVGNNALYQGVDCGNLAQSRAFTLGLKINL